MDIAILAGGYGARLKGIWDKPKCLISYRGRPLIEFLVDKALDLSPRKVFLLLGYKASKVVAWREACCPYRDVIPIIETEYEGTASAIRKALPLMTYPLLILNGDTIPLYDLTEVTNAFDDGTGRAVVAWSDEKYAGASLFGAYGMNTIKASKEPDLDYFLYDSRSHFVEVPGFIDVGTPEAFHELQSQERTTK